MFNGDSPGCRDVVCQGRDGIVVSPRDPAGFAAAMATLLGDDAARRDYAAKAAARARDFSWDRVVDTYAALYEELCATNQSGSARVVSRRAAGGR